MGATLVARFLAAPDQVSRMSRTALIVAHGQPSAPAPAEAEVRDLAREVGALLPGWRVASATLASPTALPDAIAELGNPLVFPMFMSDGWFIRSALPRRLSEAGLASPSILVPFGMLPEAQSLADVRRRVAAPAARSDRLAGAPALAAEAEPGGG